MPQRSPFPRVLSELLRAPFVPDIDPGVLRLVVDLRLEVRRQRRRIFRIRINRFRNRFHVNFRNVTHRKVFAVDVRRRDARHLSVAALERPLNERQRVVVDGFVAPEK